MITVRNGGLADLWITRRALLVYLAAVTFVFAAKGLALVPGYAFDDYTGTYADQPLAFYLSQGRYTQAVLQWLLTQTGLSTTDVAWPTTLACLLILAAIATQITLKIAKPETPFFLILPCLGIICAHPYFTEYFTFRQALYNACFYLAFTWLHLRDASRIDSSRSLLDSQNRRPLFQSILWLLLAIGGNQITAAIAASAAYATTLTEDQFSIASWKQKTILLLRALAPTVVALAMYLLLYKSIKLLFPTIVDPRGNILALQDIPSRLQALVSLAAKVVWRGEPTLSVAAKLMLAVGLVPLLSAGLLQQREPMLFWCVGLLGLAGLAILPLSLSAVWWPVPRALSALGFVTGAMAAALLAISGVNKPAYAAPWLIAAVLMALSSTAMLHQQMRLNRWDLNKALLITHDIQVRFGQTPAKHIALSGANFAFPRQLTTTDGDLNASAFVHFRSLGGLLSEASGDNIIVDDVPTIAASECRNHGHWPQGDAILETPERIYVCL